MYLNVDIKGEGFPILCLHGHPGSSRSMEVFTNYLSQRFQTIAPDLRGYGKSPTRSNFDMTDHLQDLEELLDRNEVEKCLILGWSLGGILAMELALKLPQRVTGLILIATAARPRGSHPRISWQDNFYTAIAGLVNYIKPGWEWNIETFGKKSLFRYLIQQHTPSTYNYIAKYAVPAYLQTSNYATRALSNAIATGYNRVPDLEKIQVPALVMAATEDRHITMDSSRETCNYLSQGQWCCYPETAHLFPWEVPDLMLRDMDNWLNKIY
ncbi:MAG: alpha/beta hydrolase [Cyanobacteria bacterium P01_A01_bin.84]